MVLNFFDNIQRRVCNATDPDLAYQLQLLSHRVMRFPSVKYFLGNCSDEFFSLLPEMYEFKRAKSLAIGLKD